MELLPVTVGATFGLRDPKKKFGIEIELEGENLPDILPEDTAWYAKQDGSLRRGMEYVTKPTNTPRDDVNALSVMLTERKAIIKNTYRCSTHIHRNFVSKTWKDVIATVIAWNVAEPMFLRLMPPGRDGSIFCMSAYDTGDLPLMFTRFCEEMQAKFNHYGFQTVCRQKYASLNLTRLNDLGTMEFRIFPPSVDGPEVRRWCMWIDNLVNLTEAVPAEHFGGMITQWEKEPMVFARNIFGEVPIGEAEVAALVDLGCRTGYELVRIFNNSLKKKKKDKSVKQGLRFEGIIMGEEPANGFRAVDWFNQEEDMR